jgi:penicillin-binding protein 1A
MSRFRRLGKIASVILLSVVLLPPTAFATVVGGFVFLPLPAALPEPDLSTPSQATKILDVDGEEIADLRRFDQNIQFEQDDIPQVLKDAVISSEDRSFYDHGGVDPRGTLRALWADLRNQEVVQGGSTITQQYVKKAYVGEDRTISRKVREAILAGQLDRQVDKEEILHGYLSLVYMGDGAYGVGSAAQNYFRKPLSELNASEAATLVGIIPAPSAWNPRENPEGAESRRKSVLSQMLGEGYLTQKEHDEAASQELWSEASGEPEGPATIVYNPQEVQNKYPFFVDYVRRYLTAKYGEERVFNGGLTVQTTLSQDMQRQAEETVNGTLGQTDPPLEMSLVSVEPQTGYVKALVGGRDFTKAQVNLALGGCPARPVDAQGEPMEVEVEPTCWNEDTVTGGGTGRQPGSSYKPFVLAAAYEQGISPDTVYPAPSTWSPPNCTGEGCVIRNYESQGGGSANLKRATAQSYNTVYAPLIRDVGLEHDGTVKTGFVDTAEVAKRMGVTSSYYASGFHQTGGNYSLGVIDVSPLEMASAYGIFANRGMRQTPTPVVKVVDTEGEVLEDNTARQPQRVLDEAVADNVTDALTDVVTSGTGTAADIGRPVAGKTGTSEAYTNAWFVGYTPSLATSVWMGYSDTPRTIRYPGVGTVSGGSIPTQAWAEFMEGALEDVEPTEFSEPAPISAPVRDILGEPTDLPVIPAQRRPIPNTPTGDYDNVQGGIEPATPPTTGGTDDDESSDEDDN